MKWFHDRKFRRTKELGKKQNISTIRKPITERERERTQTLTNQAKLRRYPNDIQFSKTSGMQQERTYNRKPQLE